MQIFLPPNSPSHLWHGKKYITIFDGKHEQQQTVKEKKCNLGGGMETADC